MKLFLDWSAYKDAGMGDAYADIPKAAVSVLAAAGYPTVFPASSKSSTAATQSRGILPRSCMRRSTGNCER
jgi:hypothetical protein